MKKLLVHLHLYYHDQVDFFIEKLGNIKDVDWDLIVTYSEKNEESFKKIKDLKPDAKFLQSENKGYDIWPFIKVIKSLKPDGYELVMKLHTKRSINEPFILNKIDLSGYKWRNELVDSLLFSPEQFRKTISLFEKNKKIGMVSSLLTLSYNAWDIYEHRLSDEMHSLGLSMKKGYVNLGTMFIGRMEIFLPLKSDFLTADYFNDHAARSGSNFSKSHIYERLLSLLPLSAGRFHKGLTTNKKQALRLKIGRMMKRPMEFVFCLFRKGPYHRKAMRIMGIEFYIGKPQEVNFTCESAKVDC